MSARSLDDDPLARHRSMTEALESLPSRGPAWRLALEFGIDVAQLEATQRLSVTERIDQMVSHVRFIDDLRSRNLPPELLARVERARLEVKAHALDPAGTLPR